MAQNRTFQFYGNAYSTGSSNASITVQVANTTVFSGEVSTIATAAPAVITTLDSVLFSVENNPLFSTDFSGSYPLSITLNSGDSLTIGPVLCNYMAVGNNVPGDATTFRDCYYNLVDNIFDPKSNVVINGNVQVEPVRPPVGPWFWTINTGDTLTCDLNILAGNVA